MQQLGAAEVRILIESSYKFKVFGGKKLICKFSAKGWNFRGLHKLLKKLRDSGSMTRQTGSGRRRSVHSYVSLVFTIKVQYEHNKTRFELRVYVCLFQISCGMFLPKISRIG